MNDLEKTFKKDLKDLKKLDPQTKVYLIIFILLVFIASILVGLSMRAGQSQSSSHETQLIEPTEAPTTNLSLDPPSKNMRVGEVTDVTVILSKTPVQAADIVITFDPKVFSISNIRNGTILPNILKQNLEQGKLTYSASVDPEAKNELTGEVFTFSLRALSPATSSAIDFDKNMTITSSEGKNTLGLTVGGNYTISQ